MTAPRNEKVIVGQDICRRLRLRLKGPYRKQDETGDDLTDDDVLLMEALECIEALRWRRPEQVRAERIIAEGARLLGRDHS